MQELELIASHVVLHLAATSTADHRIKRSPSDRVWEDRIRKGYIDKGGSIQREQKSAICAIPCQAHSGIFMQETALAIHR